MTQPDDALFLWPGPPEDSGIQTPATIFNPPGNTTIAYRVGTYDQFRQTMLTRLSVPDAASILQHLKTREDSDFSIALLDAWALVADILTFYQERIATESYRRTATEQASLLYMSLLVGTKLRPGISAGTYLAFTVDGSAGAPGQVTIDAGTKVQSVPGPGEQAQVFETSDPIEAYAEFNAVQPLRTRPQPIRADMPSVLCNGIITDLRVGDAVLIIAPDAGGQALRRVSKIAVDTGARQSRVFFDPMPPAPASTPTTSAPATQVVAMRTRASLFGHNVPDWTLTTQEVPTQQIIKQGNTTWEIDIKQKAVELVPVTQPVTAQLDQLDLDTVYSQILPGSLVAVVQAGPGATTSTTIATVTAAVETAAAAKSFSTKITRLKLQATQPGAPARIDDVRTVTVYAQTGTLDWAPTEADPAPVEGGQIELDRIYSQLYAGQTIAIWGEQDGHPGVRVAEIAVLAETVLTANHTQLVLDEDLTYHYSRAKVTINANVVHATHGETVQEVLGSGDAGVAFQSFTLRRAPLAYLPAPTSSGMVSTLKVFVDGLLWQEKPGLFATGTIDPIYITRTDADGKTVILFGDGKTGTRLPTGQENVTATYRVGGGLAGMVMAGQLTLLMTRALGVASVTNPLAATGGADGASLDSARADAGLVVRTIDRLISLQDYQDFAQAYAGVAKALATQTWDGAVRGVLVTVAGPEGVVDSRLCQNLLAAMQGAGNAHMALRVAPYHLVLFRIAASVAVDPAFVPASVLPSIERALQSAFSFDGRSLGQGVAKGEVLAVIQAVPGVDHALIDQLYRTDAPASLQTSLPAAPSPDVPIRVQGGTIQAAELLLLDPGPVPLKVLP